MAKGGNTVRVVTGLIEPVVEELGLILWDVRYEKEGASWYLRVIIDSEDGVDLNDCERVSRGIDPVLDEADPIPTSYYLEVSSPGIERDLTKDWHFEQYLGQPVRLRFIREQDGVRELEGILLSYDGEKKEVCLDCNGEEYTVNRGDTSYIRACDVYEEGDDGEE